MYVFYYRNYNYRSKSIEKNEQKKNKYSNKEQTKSPVVQCQFEWIGTGHCVKESEKTPVSTF